MKIQIKNNTFIVIFASSISMMLLPLIYNIHAAESLTKTSGLGQSPIHSYISELKDVMEKLKTNFPILFEVLQKTQLQLTKEGLLETYKEFEQAFKETLDNTKMLSNIMHKIQLVLVDSPLVTAPSRLFMDTLQADLKIVFKEWERARSVLEKPALIYEGLKLEKPALTYERFKEVRNRITNNTKIFLETTWYIQPILFTDPSVENELKAFMNQLQPDPKKVSKLLETTIPNGIKQLQTSLKTLLEVLEKTISDEEGHPLTYESFEIIRCNITNYTEKLLDVALDIGTVLFPQYSVELRLRNVIEKLTKDSARISEMLEKSFSEDIPPYASLDKEKFENIYALTRNYNTKIARIVQCIRDNFDTTEIWNDALNELFFVLNNINSLLSNIFQHNLFCIEEFGLSFAKNVYKLIRVDLFRSNEIAKFILDYFLIISSNHASHNDQSSIELLKKLYDSIKNEHALLSRPYQEVETSVSDIFEKQEQIEQGIRGIKVNEDEG